MDPLKRKTSKTLFSTTKDQRLSFYLDESPKQIKPSSLLSLHTNTSIYRVFPKQLPQQINQNYIYKQHKHKAQLYSLFTFILGGVSLILAIIFLPSTVTHHNELTLLNPASKLLIYGLLTVLFGIKLTIYIKTRGVLNRNELIEEDSFDSKILEQIKSQTYKQPANIQIKDVSKYLSRNFDGITYKILKEQNINLGLLLQIISSQSKIIQQIFDNINLSLHDLIILLTKEPNLQITSKDYELLLLKATDEAIYMQSEELLTSQVELIHFVLAIMETYQITNHFLRQSKVSIGLFRETSRYYLIKLHKIKNSGLLSMQKKYIKTGGAFKDWVYGYTFILNKFSSDLTLAMTTSKETYGIGHTKEVEALAAVVGKVADRHAILIGEPGVGKSSIIKGLAQKINYGDVPQQLYNKRIIQLDINKLVASSGNTTNNGNNSLESLVEKAIFELTRAGNTILYIDEIQELFPSKNGNKSVASVMLPYILDSKFPIVGTINHADYKRVFASNSSLSNSFTAVEIAELTIQETLQILESMIPILETQFRLKITFPALLASSELAKRYINDKLLPNSAVTVLESSCSYAQGKGIKRLLPEHVSDYISLQTHIAVSTVDDQEASKLLNLESKIAQKVIGQEGAIKALSEALRRLFLGPTGTGKTYIAKTVANEMFGSQENMIRIDMSEYQEVSSINRLLGSNNKDGLNTLSLLDQVKNNPYTVLLFDEIEKANPKILDLFLQLFDEGHLTNLNGESVDFTNTIMICTSNIGSDILLNSLQKDLSNWEETQKLVIQALRTKIRPELFNRYDKTIVFQPLSVESLNKIVLLELKKLQARLKSQGLSIVWKENIPALIAQKVYEPALGARPIKRYLQDNIENRLSEAILRKEFLAGGEVEIKEEWI